MEVSIRLQKSETRAKGRYQYRVVAIPKQAPRQAKALEILGYYNPDDKAAALDFKLDRIDHWVGQGAQMSDTVRSIVLRLKRKK